MSNFKEILKRLQSLKEYYKSLRYIQKKYSLESIKKDLFIRYTLERLLHLAAESSIDIGEIIISGKSLESPYFNKDVFRILGEAKILNKKLSDSFQEIAKFRNILVHDYVKLDLEKMYGYLENNLDDFDKYIKAIGIYLKKEYGKK